MSLTHYQQAINLAIAAVEYRPSLPNGLDEDILYKAFDWNKHRARNNSLEWLGDSLLYAAISAELFNQLPEGNESLYSNVRPHLLSNKTFALLTHKMGISTSLLHPSILKSRPPHPESKCYADLFEVIAAEIYFYASFDTLRDWVAEVFKPLIIAASGAFESHPPKKWMKRKATGVSLRSPKRRKIIHKVFGRPGNSPRKKSWLNVARHLGLGAVRMRASSEQHGGGAPESSSSSSSSSVMLASIFAAPPVRPVSLRPTQAGPGWSRYDPIVIDEDEEENEKDSPPVSPEVIEINSDDGDN